MNKENRKLLGRLSLPSEKPHPKPSQQRKTPDKASNKVHSQPTSRRVQGHPTSLRHSKTQGGTQTKLTPSKRKENAIPSVKKKEGKPFLRRQRRRAVRRGLKWLAWFAKKRWSYKSLGTDAVYIFKELSANTPDRYVRKFSYRVARRLAIRVKKHYEKKKSIKSRDDALDALDLLTFSKYLKFSPQPLLSMVEKKIKKHPTAAQLFDVELTQLKELTEDEVYDLLINTYILKKAEIIFPGRFKINFKLVDTLRFLRTRRYVSFHQDKTDDKEVFEDHAYLATHVALVLNNYGRLRLRRSMIPKVYPFLRRNFQAILEDKDIELVAEFIDVFRSIGLHEGNDSQVKRGTKFLLKSQHKDGSWGPWKKEKDAYDAIHYTWCAVLGLRERTFWKGTVFDKKRMAIFRQLRLERIKRRKKKGKKLHYKLKK